MTRDEIRNVVFRCLSEIAPEADPAQLKPDVPFRDQLDLDSMDLLNVLIALHKELGVEIPERDYPKLATLNDCVEYLATARGVQPAGLLCVDAHVCESARPAAAGEREEQPNC